MLRRILVPLDGSALAEEALPVAAAIARRRGAQLHLVGVHEPMAEWVMTTGMPPGVVEETRTLDRQRREALSAHLGRRLAEVASRFDVTACESILESDQPVAEQLAGYVTSHQVDLVVMTTHGRGFVNRWWLGSVADHLLRLAVAPCLILGRRASRSPGAADHATPPFRRVLLPLDGAPASEAAIEQALELVDPADAELLLLQVVLPIDWLMPPSPIASGPMEGPALDRRSAHALAYLDRVAQRLRDRGVATRTMVVGHSNPPAAILDVVESEHVDLLAVAAPARSGVDRFLLGSVLDKLVRHAPVPVLASRGLRSDASASALPSAGAARRPASR